MKKIIFSIFLGITFSIVEPDNKKINRSGPPVVYYLESLPNYGRKKPLKKHYKYYFS